MNKRLLGFMISLVCFTMYVGRFPSEIAFATDDLSIIHQFNADQATQAIVRMEEAQRWKINTPTVIRSYTNTSSLAERCISDYGEHSVPVPKTSNTCGCEPGYVFGKNKQCELSEKSKLCKQKHGMHSYQVGALGICVCEQGYMSLSNLDECVLGSTPTEACQNVYGDDSIVMPDGNTCTCKDGYKMLDDACHETIRHKIKNFFLLLF